MHKSVFKNHKWFSFLSAFGFSWLTTVFVFSWLLIVFDSNHSWFASNFNVTAFGFFWLLTVFGFSWLFFFSLKIIADHWSIDVPFAQNDVPFTQKFTVINLGDIVLWQSMTELTERWCRKAGIIGLVSLYALNMFFRDPFQTIFRALKAHYYLIELPLAIVDWVFRQEQQIRLPIVFRQFQNSNELNSHAQIAKT